MSLGESFVGRFDFARTGVVGRAYVHKYGFKEAFGEDIVEAALYVRDVMKSDVLAEASEKNFGYSVAVVWGRFQDRMIDFFGIDANPRSGDWTGNAAIYSWVVQNGVAVPKKDVSMIGCEDGLAILAEEAKYRRGVHWDDYTSVGPEIEGLVSTSDYSVPKTRYDMAKMLRARLDEREGQKIQEVRDSLNSQIAQKSLSLKSAIQVAGNSAERSKGKG